MSSDSLLLWQLLQNEQKISLFLTLNFLSNCLYFTHCASEMARDHPRLLAALDLAAAAVAKVTLCLVIVNPIVKSVVVHYGY